MAFHLQASVPLVEMGEDQEHQDVAEPFVDVEQVLVDQGTCNSMNQREMFVRFDSLHEHMYLEVDVPAFL